MITLREIVSRDGDVWTVEDEGGDLFLTHCHDSDGGGPRMVVPIEADVLEALAGVVRARTVIGDRSQRVIQFPVRRVA